MAIKIADEYVNSNPASGPYPGGSFKNSSTPTTQDGTPLEESWPNDIQGLLQAIILEAGLTPSGVPDTAVASQYLDGLKALFINDDRFELSGCSSRIAFSDLGQGNTPGGYAIVAATTLDLTIGDELRLEKIRWAVDDARDVGFAVFVDGADISNRIWFISKNNLEDFGPSVTVFTAASSKKHAVYIMVDYVSDTAGLPVDGGVWAKFGITRV